MTTPDTLTTERILNAAVGIGVPVEKYGWRRVEMGWYRKDGYHTIWARDATPADRKAIICEIVERLGQYGTDIGIFECSPGKWCAVQDPMDEHNTMTITEPAKDFDTAAVNAALKVGGEG